MYELGLRVHAVAHYQKQSPQPLSGIIENDTALSKFNPSLEEPK